MNELHSVTIRNLTINNKSLMMQQDEPREKFWEIYGFTIFFIIFSCGLLIALAILIKKFS